MKTIKKLCKVLTIYLASRCPRKLISSEEVNEEILVQILRNPDIEINYTLLHSSNHREQPYSTMLFTKEKRESALQEIVKRTPFLKGAPGYNVTFLLKKYALGKGLILCILEYRDELRLTADIMVVKHFQWIE